MIFKEIYIDGFGIFNTFNRSLSKGVNIIIGCNEAGKSTLQKFFKFTLFGYPTKTDERMPPINGGLHGGRIKAKILPEKEIIFERISGGKGGDITLRYDDIEVKNPTQWFQFLGHATKELYNNVYAFSLDELVNLDSLSYSGVEDKIFSVGLGLGSTSLGSIESNIKNEIDLIYLPKGRGGQDIPKILAEIQSKKLRIQHIQNNLTVYQNLLNEIKQLETDIIPLIDSGIKESREEYNKLNDYLKCYNSFISIDNIDKELKILPALKEYAIGGVTNMDRLIEKQSELENKIEELKEGVEDDKGIAEIEREVKLVSFNSELLERKDKVEYIRNNLANYKQLVNDKISDDEKIKFLEQSVRNSMSDIDNKWTVNNIEEFSNIILHQNNIEGFKKKFIEIENKKIQLEAERKALKAKESSLNLKALIIIISLIFLIGSISAFLYKLNILSISFLLIALMLFVSRKFILKDNSLTKIQNELNDLENEIEFPLKKQYAEYLVKTLKLDKSLLPERVFEIFGLIDQIKKSIDEKEGIMDKQTTQKIPLIKKFEEEVDLLRKYLITDNFIDIESSVNQIKIEFDNSKNQFQTKVELQEKSNRKNYELKLTNSKLQKIQEEIKALLESINAENNDDFQMKYEKNNRVKTLMTEKKNAIQTIEAIIGLGKTTEVIEYFLNNEKQTVENQKNNFHNKLAETEEEFKLKHSELVEKQTEVKRIEGESELALMLTELETEKQKLNNKYKDWLAGKMALKILEKVKGKYEIEKQPEVIKNSSKYFSKITDKKYTRISASLEDKDVSVFDSYERSKKLNQLSRGTKEQLLISLRLGFIEEYEKTSEPLPLIVDEVLVNFDSIRAKQTAKILHEFAENRQILIFTCHPSTKDYFENLPVNVIEV